MDQRIEQAIFYITKNYYKPLVLDAICASVRLSKFHFHRMFKADTGMTPLQFWHQIRIQHAQHFALQYPNSKQLEVGFICGFVSPPIFARAFQKQMGMSMLQFREANATTAAHHKINERILPFDIVYLVDQVQIKKGVKSIVPNGYYLKLKGSDSSDYKNQIGAIKGQLEAEFSQVNVRVKNYIQLKKSTIRFYAISLK
jgi:AraC-like DNA-binding protein